LFLKVNFGPFKGKGIETAKVLGDMDADVHTGTYCRAYDNSKCKGKSLIKILKHHEHRSIRNITGENDTRRIKAFRCF
jgi:hypothetical protein